MLLKFMTEQKDQKEPNLNNLTARQKWLWTNCVPNVVKSIHQREGLLLTANEVFEIFRSSDPSANNSAVQWLMETYQRKGFLHEDLIGGKTSKVWETLVLFNKFKSKLDVKKRSLFCAKSLAELYQNIEPYVLKEYEKNKGSKIDLTEREIKIEQKIKAADESLIVWDSDNLKIVVPQTKFAAQWWGMGTRWCTSAKNNNFFEHYNNQSPLFVLCFQQTVSEQNSETRARKIQLWINENNIQFMDETDATVNPNLIHSHWSIFKPFIMLMSKKNKHLFQYIPDHARDQEMYENAVSFGMDFFHLSDVPDKMRTLKICLSAIKADARNINAVPEKYFDQDEIISKCLTHHSSMIKHWVRNNVDSSIIKKCVETNGLSINSLPDYHLTQEICMAAVRSYPAAIRYVPDKFYNLEILQLAVRADAQILKIIHKKDIDQNLCNLVLDHDNFNLDCVPEQFRTIDICTRAVEQNGINLQFVPQKLKSLSICMIALARTRSSTIFEFVPKELIDDEICLAALKSDYNCLSKIPQSMLTEEMALILVSKKASLLTVLPKSLKTPEICLRAVEKSPESFNFIPNNAIDPKIVFAFIKHRIENIANERVRKTQWITHEMCKMVAVKEPRLLTNVPQSMLTQEIYLLACNHPNGLAIVPQNLRTEEMVAANNIAKKRIENIIKHKQQIKQNKRSEKVQNTDKEVKSIPDRKPPVMYINPNQIKKQMIEYQESTIANEQKSETADVKLG